MGVEVEMTSENFNKKNDEDESSWTIKINYFSEKWEKNSMTSLSIASRAIILISMFLLS